MYVVTLFCCRGHLPVLVRSLVCSFGLFPVCVCVVCVAGASGKHTDETDSASDSSDSDDDEDQLELSCENPARQLTLCFASPAERLQWSGLLQTRLSMARSAGATSPSASLLQAMKSTLRFLSCGSFAVAVQKLGRSRKPKYRQRRVFLFEDALIVSQQQYFVLYDTALPLADCTLNGMRRCVLFVCVLNTPLPSLPSLALALTL
jgi:hypothetical protein